MSELPGNSSERSNFVLYEKCIKSEGVSVFVWATDDDCGQRGHEQLYSWIKVEGEQIFFLF